MPLPVLQTSRLTLRPFVADDAPALFAYASAPAFSRYVAYDSPATLAEAQAFLEAVLLPENAAHRAWAICRHGAPEVIGTLQVTHDAPGTATVHYDLSHHWYGQGFATEALGAVLHWYLDHEPTVHTFLGDTTSDNRASQRVLEKCGFAEVRRETVQWEKVSEPVELIVFEATPASILGRH